MAATIIGKQKITPCLWFDNRAEEAVDFYTSVFEDSKIISKTYYGNIGPGQKGTLLTAVFELNGVEFMVLNGGPKYNFTPATSFQVHCETQEEVDHYWYKLSEGGREEQCAWLTDKYGLSWQIVPNTLIRLMSDKDSNKSQKVMGAMLKMTKIDIKALEKAYNEA